MKKIYNGGSALLSNSSPANAGSNTTWESNTAQKTTSKPPPLIEEN